jgi:anoctamin-8
MFKVGSFFKKRFTTIGKSVVTNRIWLKSSKSSICHVLITFPSDTTYETVFILLDRILKEDLVVNIKYHKTTHRIGLYLTASYERFLKGAEELELKKPIKSNYGGGIKEFIFEEQEFYENIENGDMFLTTQEKQSIVYEIINRIKCDKDIDPIVINGKPVPDGRKLSNTI